MPQIKYKGYVIYYTWMRFTLKTEIGRYLKSGKWEVYKEFCDGPGVFTLHLLPAKWKQWRIRRYEKKAVKKAREIIEDIRMKDEADNLCELFAQMNELNRDK